MQTLLHDLRYAIRMLLRQPIFSLIALLTLALGIGANTAMFSLIHAVLLRPLAYPNADRLVRVWTSVLEKGKGMEQAPLSFPRYDFIREQQSVFDDLAASSGGGFTLTGRGDPEQLIGGYVTARFFQTLGVQPALGRLFLAGEDQPGSARLVVLSYTCWQKRFNADPAILGQSLVLNGAPCVVVGVLSATLGFPFDRLELYMPGVSELPGIPANVIRQGTGVVNVTARLKPDVSLARANEDLRRLAAQYKQAFPDHVDASFGIKAISFQEEIVGQSRPAFYTLAGATGCVLLIACVNVANLLLARLAGRRKEIAIRAALGAGRFRLVRQFLTETLLLTLLAGTLGTLLALWCVDLAHGLGPEVIPRAGEIRLSGTTLLFTLFVSLVAGLLLGVAPALHAARGNPGEALQQAGGRGSAGGVRQGRARATLLIAQVALSLVLLTGTGLLLTSLWQLQRVHLGFDPGGVLTGDVVLPVERYPQPEQRPDFFARLTERVNALPGVKNSAAAVGTPMTGAGGNMFYSVVGQPVPPIQERPAAKYCAVSPGYFSTLEIPILQGRAFTERDRVDAPPVMIINETMAKKLFPDGNVLGQKLLCSASNPTVTEIVGIMADARTISVAEAAVPEMYFSMFQRGEPFMNLLVRAQDPARADSLIPAVRSAIRSLDSSQSIADVEELNNLVTRSMADRQLMSVLLASFAGLALVLAAIGIYGVAAYGVVQRTREIGIRMALGAQRGDVFRLIIGSGMKLIGVGIVIGALSALGLTRLLASMLYGVGASDPLTFVTVICILTLVALVANYLPARWATQIDPLIALREE